MQEWIKQVFEHNWPYTLVTLIPQECYTHDLLTPAFDNPNMNYVVFIGVNPLSREYVVGRIWKHTVNDGYFEWDNGAYISNLDYGRALSVAAEKARL